jgi:enterochelin esterase family protein
MAPTERCGLVKMQDVIGELRAAAVDGVVPPECWTGLVGRLPQLVDRGDGTMELTLVAPLPANGAAVFATGGWLNGGASGRLLHRIDGIDALARTWTVSSALLSTYMLWTGNEPVDLPDDLPGLLEVMPRGRWEGDPLAGELLRYPFDPENPGPPMAHGIVRGPHADAEPWVAPRAGGETGAITEHRLASALLGNERRVWVHTPAGLDSATPAPLLLVWDGGIYAHVLSCGTILDNLTAAEVVPPMVTVFCHYADDGSRNAELAGNPLFERMVLEELVPWAAANWNVTGDPRRRILLGSSLGGLASILLAYRHPELAANAVAQSGSFGWHPNEPDETDWAATHWQVDGPVDCHLWLEMGLYETLPGPDGRSGYEHTQQFLAAARARGTDVVYRDYSGGHDYLCWRATFPLALQSIVERW